MTISALYRVWETSQQSGAHLLAMMYIADGADPVSGKAFFRTERIALMTRVRIEDVDSLLGDLVARGEIIAEPRSSIMRGDGYEVTLINYREPDKPAPSTERPQINWALRQQVFERDGHRCRYCGSGANLSIDHMVPSSKGGTDSPLNLVACCRSCNSRKGARTPEEANMTLRNPFVDEVLA